MEHCYQIKCVSDLRQGRNLCFKLDKDFEKEFLLYWIFVPSTISSLIPESKHYLILAAFVQSKITGD